MGWLPTRLLERAPSLNLDWELGLFRLLHGLWRGVAGAEPGPGPHAALLEPISGRLRVFAGLIAGRPLRVSPAAGEGGLRGDTLLLPPVMDLAPSVEGNQALYLLRVALAAQAMAHGATGGGLLQELRALREAADALSAALPEFGAAYAAGVALELGARPTPESLGAAASLQERARQATLRGERPWSDEALLRALDSSAGPSGPPLRLWGRLFSSQLEMLEPGAAADGPQTPVGQEQEAPPIDEVKLAQLKAATQLPSHSFEKVETADAFNGVARDLDGEDELEEQLEALKEVPLGSLLRGGPPAQSLLRADLRLDVDIPHVGDIGPDERAVLVDEWDRSAQRLRPGWCKVYPTALGQGSQDWAIEALGRHHRLVQRLHQRLLRRREALRAQPRQLDGEEVDLDALLTAYGDTLSGHSPEPRWYQRMARRDPDTATLVLMDLSLSTDSWVQDRRVLDVCREAVLVLGELSERLHERLRVMAFASQTRNQVRAWDIKTWEDPWMRARGRLGMLKPQGYTRIGPALRYAASELKKVRARRRVLLLLSDGKPTDYDRYEGRYGLADVGHAIRQARGWGLRVHALAVAEHAQETLPAMMGPGGYTLLPRPEALLEALVLLGR